MTDFEQGKNRSRSVLEINQRRRNNAILADHFGLTRYDLILHTTYCMSTKKYPLYLYIHLKNCRRQAENAIGTHFSKKRTSKGSC